VFTPESYKIELLENLTALRHLPPGTQLPRPPTDRTPMDEEQRLLSDLVRLPEAVNPMLWLQSERGDLIARMSLYWAVECIVMFSIGVRRARAARLEAPMYKRALLGDLVHVPEDAEPLRKLERAAPLVHPSGYERGLRSCRF
jgi:hypothetical protein